MAVNGEATPVMERQNPKTRKAAATTTASTATTSAATQANSRNLAGPYGASFTGEGTRGLTFERRWTTPGVHPYDEVAWEYRTAGIANESGKSVF